MLSKLLLLTFAASVKDFHVSFAQELITLLNFEKYKILLYSGQLDVIIGTSLTEAFLKQLDWKGTQNYLNSAKEIWRVKPTDAEVAGYRKSVGNFSYVVVRRAGHIAPFDQPRAMMDLINKFVNE